MEREIMLASKDKCTGCGACKAICPRSAIQFTADNEGFPSPVIDEKFCIRCGRCMKACPVLSAPERHSVNVAYAAQICDNEALMDSTSGGMFTAFAREVFKDNGVVYGCIWDDEYSAFISRAENEEEIKPMRGSKYVWSWAGDAFPGVRNDLEAGRTVLFTGLPCQVAGLKNYLRKDYQNLYLVDFFCGGAPSPYAFHEYLKTITRDVPLDKIDLKFRDKDKYGVGVHISYLTTKGKKIQTYVHNPYFFSYHTKVCHRPSCYHCQYRYAERIEDITFGDYWGVEKFHPEFDIKAGVSALLVNTAKGAELLEAVKEELKLSETRIEDIAVGNNLTLSDKQVVFHEPSFRNAFFETLRAKGWSTAEKKYLYNKTRLKLWLKLKVPSKYIKVLKRIVKGR